MCSRGCCVWGSSFRGKLDFGEAVSFQPEAQASTQGENGGGEIPVGHPAVDQGVIAQQEVPDEGHGEGNGKAQKA